MVTNILDYLEQTAQRLPDKTALADDKLSLSFCQWVLQAESIGTAIAEATNNTIRRAVLVFVDRRIEGLVGAMGAVESGNFYVPIDCKMPFERVRLIARLSSMDQDSFTMRLRNTRQTSRRWQLSVSRLSILIPSTAFSPVVLQVSPKAW